MKHEAEQELLKTLNGQLSELPAVAKTMVQQYQMSAIVLSILCGVLFIAALIGTIWLSHYFFKKGENQSLRDKVDGTDYTTGCIATSFVGGSLSVIMLLCLVINVIHACAPIASIIKDLLN
ncbi:hypothetical protein EAI26_06345 [Lactobacillus sp. 0.1XD8-4]|uniref:hypothetical protein n=1 Tax=uncultured Limosilactobacillus sp. TaxID=2837629 RepID=UPI00129D93E0|nr:hypothetical protein [uncultured Limosilactobacillus sp.]MRN07005.1 hypothetical protein [Lactobacillus sp. 0.1XD8-4]